MNLAESVFELAAGGRIKMAAEIVQQWSRGFDGTGLDAAARGSEKHAAGATVFGVDHPADQAATLQERENGRHRVGIRGRALDERNLGQAFVRGNDAQGHKLIGCDAELEHAGVRAAVKAEISLAKEHSEFVAGVHEINLRRVESGGWQVLF